MDGEGNKVIEKVGALSIINIRDVSTKIHILSYPQRLKSKFSHPKREDYQTCLRLAFIDFGRCKRLQVDHESVFFENTHDSPYPTKFHLWMVGMGIPICFTPKGKPQQQGAVERSHQTLDRQVFQGRDFNNWEEVLEQCWKRRNRLNEHIPCRTLQGKAPLQYSPEAKHSGLEYSPEKEEELFKPIRIYQYLSKGEWYRNIDKNRTIHLGGWKYVVKIGISQMEVRIKFNLKKQCFRVYDSNQQLVQTFKPKGLDFNSLCGNLNEFKIWYKKYKYLIRK